MACSGRSCADPVAEPAPKFRAVARATPALHMAPPLCRSQSGSSLSKVSPAPFLSLKPQLLSLSLYIYIYTYMYVCMYVCIDL
ncbi:hypothetical protein QVD17_00471 [Tagetes erecta]|uniref:Uncharacterized protein n=1 Tax=Tagetes erecta TaxID=13708 RepID=A0AAD8L8U9_TARER|nr:hypothetical protein QVD17_00471 [Tagetes erecta]